MNKTEAVDCMGRTIIEYEFGFEITKERLKKLEEAYGGEVSYQTGSPFYNLNVPHKFLLKGTVGEKSLVVTLKEKDSGKTVSELESVLKGMD